MARWEDGPNVPRKLTWNPLATGATCSLYLGWTWLAGCLKISSGKRAEVGPCFTTSSVFPAEIIMVTIIYEGREKKEKGILAHPYPRKWSPSDTYASSSVENSWVVWSTRRNRTSSRLHRPCPSWWWHRQDFPRIPRNRLSASLTCPTNGRSRRNRTPCNPIRFHRSRRIGSATKGPSSLLPVDEISLRCSRPDVDRSNRRTDTNDTHISQAYPPSSFSTHLHYRHGGQLKIAEQQSDAARRCLVRTSDHVFQA